MGILRYWSLFLSILTLFVVFGVFLATKTWHYFAKKLVGLVPNHYYSSPVAAMQVYGKSDIFQKTMGTEIDSIASIWKFENRRLTPAL